MQKTKVEKATPEKLAHLDIGDWSPWSCEPKEFEWEYPEEEKALIKKGKAIVTEESGQKVEINAGDLVTFPLGLKCHWRVLEKIEKVYHLDITML
ncbi:MAG: DUF861 domain-containing protein [Candidatus Saganbacteria bacterium]|nr:DUF861 domain-containing protein [Candidatus Saganbacteria bacterium]